MQRPAVDGNLDTAIDATLPRFDFAKQRAAATTAARALAAHVLFARVAGHPEPASKNHSWSVSSACSSVVITDRIDTAADGTTIMDCEVGESTDDFLSSPRGRYCPK